MVLNYNIEQYDALIFDLDDTVYEELDYLKKAYKHITKLIIESESNHNLSERIIYSFLLSTFRNEGRIGLFQKTVAKFNLNNFSIDNFKQCLRAVSTIDNEIKINKPIYNFIIKFNTTKDLFILTNGNVTQQQNKIRSLNIPFKEKIRIYYSSSLGREFEKPNPYFVFKIINDHNLNKNQVIFIGDSEVDEKTANAADIDYMNYKVFSKTLFK
jgi:HAD superfamily hydrolase (TIGR01549 family)